MLNVTWKICNSDQLESAPFRQNQTRQSETNNCEVSYRFLFPPDLPRFIRREVCRNMSPEENDENQSPDIEPENNSVESRRQESENTRLEDLEHFHTYLEERIQITDGAQDRMEGMN